MSLLETDLYFINLDLISLAELITQKISPIQQDLDLKARIVLFIHSLGSKHAKKLIFNHLTHSAIKVAITTLNKKHMSQSLNFLLNLINLLEDLAILTILMIMIASCCSINIKVLCQWFIFTVCYHLIISNQLQHCLMLSSQKPKHTIIYYFLIILANQRFQLISIIISLSHFQYFLV